MIEMWRIAEAIVVLAICGAAGSLAALVIELLRKESD